MTTPEFRREIQKLDHLIKLASATDDEIKPHMARYLCVLISGLLENSVREILTRFAGQQSSPSVVNYVSATLNRFQNPKWERISDILNQFNREWTATLATSLGEKTIDALNSIVANRHEIAHGKSVGLSLGTLIRYYTEAVVFIDALEALCS